MSLQTRIIYLQPAESPELDKPGSFGFVPWAIMKGLPSRELFITNSTVAAKFLQDRALQTVVVSVKELPLDVAPEKESLEELELNQKTIAINWRGRPVFFIFDKDGEVTEEEFTTVSTSILAKGGAELKNAVDFDDAFKEFSEKMFQKHVVAKFSEPETQAAHKIEHDHWAKVEKKILDEGLDKGHGEVKIKLD
jgi:hypothetical protein